MNTAVLAALESKDLMAMMLRKLFSSLRNAYPPRSSRFTGVVASGNSWGASDRYEKQEGP